MQMRKGLVFIWQTALFLVVLGLGWELLIFTFNFPPYILPSPSLVVKALIAQGGVIMQNTAITLLEIIVGLSLGIGLGCIVALLMAVFLPLRLFFKPSLIISQALPTLAIAPLLVIWFGYGIASKIMTTILMLFFPVASAFFDGLTRSNNQWLELARTMRASKWQYFYHIQIPAAVPSLASGIRVATAVAPIGAIVGEWVGSSQGLGFLLLNANARMQIDMMFACLLVIVILALVLYFSVDALLTRWLDKREQM